MDSVRLRSLTRKRLVAMAKKAGIPRWSRLAKEQLVIALAARMPSEVPPQEPTELPSSYGRTRLTLMEIEPFWIYAYWEVTPQDFRSACDQLGDAGPGIGWVLRFYDITGAPFPGNAHDYFDVPVDLKAGNWYINLWSGDKSYFAEIGPRSGAGRFLAVSRSNVICVPRAGPPPYDAAAKAGGDESPAHDSAAADLAAVASQAPIQEDRPGSQEDAPSFAPGQSGREKPRPVLLNSPHRHPACRPEFLHRDDLPAESTGSFLLGIDRAATSSAAPCEWGAPSGPRRGDPQEP